MASQGGKGNGRGGGGKQGKSPKGGGTTQSRATPPNVANLLAASSASAAQIAPRGVAGGVINPAQADAVGSKAKRRVMLSDYFT